MVTTGEINRKFHMFYILGIITLRASCGAVYCNRSYLWVCLWVCYHDNSKLRASILTKLGLDVNIQLLNVGRPAPPGKGSAAGRKFLALPYYSQRAVFASLWAHFSLVTLTFL